VEKLEVKADSAFWEGRSVLVTGGTGLVGSWLVKKLIAARAQIVLLVKDTNPQSEISRSGDIHKVAVTYGVLEDFGALESAINLYDVDTVFHLGAQTQTRVAHRYPLGTFESNIRGTYNVLEACRVHADLVRRVVIASTDKAYGTQKVLPYTETTPLDARHTYDVSKSCADLLAQAYVHTYRLPIGITRFGNVYGGGDWNLNRVVPGTINSLARSKSPVIRSDGTPLRDYIYVEDVAEGYLRLAEKSDDPTVTGQAFNFSNEKPVSVLEIVAKIRKLMGREDLEPVIQNVATAEIAEQSLDATKAKKLLGWRPRFTLEEGLKKTIEWYLAARDF
jgi:CDP-glucose 4,6-dehydratase